MRNDETISVIIPTYNREHHILESLESVLNQTYENLEVIIVDDASTDNTEEVVLSIKDERVKYHKLKENGKVAHARNIGVSLASSEVIAFHDSDDVCMKDRLEKQYNYLRNNTEYGLIYSAILVKKGNQRAIFPPKNYSEKLEGNIHKEILLSNTIDCPTIMMKKKIFEEVGGFDETYPNLSDWEFVIRVSEHHNIGYINEPLIESVLLDTGISSSRTNFYATRARMIATEKVRLEKEGIFTQAIQQYLCDAEKEGMLEFAKLSIEKEVLKIFSKKL